MTTPDLTLDAVAKILRKDGHPAGALLIEMGVMKLFFDFRKRARAENIDTADQIDAIAKMFASLIMPFATGIPDDLQRLKVITSLLQVVEGHMTSTAAQVFADGLITEAKNG